MIVDHDVGETIAGRPSAAGQQTGTLMVEPDSAEPMTLLTQFNLTTAAEELVPRLTQAEHHDTLLVLLEVFEAETEARRQRRDCPAAPDLASAARQDVRGRSTPEGCRRRSYSS